MKFKRRMQLEVGLKQIEITPLIDCVFLLLIFFMLTSNFIIAPGINIRLPEANSAEVVETTTVTVTISSEDIIYIKGKVLTEGELSDYLKEAKPKSIFIKSDQDTSLGVVVGIWDICRKLGIERVSIATTQREQ